MNIDRAPDLLYTAVAYALIFVGAATITYWAGLPAALGVFCLIAGNNMIQRNQTHNNIAEGDTNVRLECSHWIKVNHERR